MMETVFKLTNAEARLAELLWDNAPIASMEMIKMARREFDWKKSTTFSVLKILIEKGVAKNENSCVTMLYTRDEFLAGQSCRYVDDAYGGSLPMFVASFASNRKLTPEQIAELKRLIELHEGGGQAEAETGGGQAEAETGGGRAEAEAGGGRAETEAGGGIG